MRAALAPHSIPGLVRSSRHPRVPLPCRPCTQPLSALVFSPTTAALRPMPLAAVVFYPITTAAAAAGLSPNGPSRR